MKNFITESLSLSKWDENKNTGVKTVKFYKSLKVITTSPKHSPRSGWRNLQATDTSRVWHDSPPGLCTFSTVSLNFQVGIVWGDKTNKQAAGHLRLWCCHKTHTQQLGSAHPCACLLWHVTSLTELWKSKLFSSSLILLGNQVDTKII